MARVSANKSSLAKQTRLLKTYQRFLPSLDLKRKQLMAERAKAIAARQATEARLAQTQAAVGRDIPMLANREIDLTDLVKLAGAELGEENVVGTRLPVLLGIQVQVRDYGALTKPHWVDRLVEVLRQTLELRVRLLIEQRRMQLLEEAVRKVTQRVNLFEKVLIPRTRETIRRIQIFLADNERAAVVRSKIAKRKRAAEGMA
jgi:V/A-type H+-transporting ATPase subunit D